MLFEQLNKQYCCKCCLQVRGTSSSSHPWGLSMTLARYFSSGQWITWLLPKEEKEATGRCSLEQWPTEYCSQAAGMHLEMWESDKGILELFGGYSSLLKNDTHIGESPRYSVQWKKPGSKSKGDGIQCPGISVCLCLVGISACVRLHGRET